MQYAKMQPSNLRRRSLICAAVAGTAITAVLSFGGPAFAAGNSNFTPPPGCTGSWNTTPSATFNHAPGTAPGCAVAVSHTS